MFHVQLNYNAKTNLGSASHFTCFFIGFVLLPICYHDWNMVTLNKVIYEILHIIFSFWNITPFAM